MELLLPVLSWVVAGGYKLVGLAGGAAALWVWWTRKKGKIRAEVHERDRIADRQRARQAIDGADAVGRMSDDELGELLMEPAGAEPSGAIVVPGTPRHRARLHTGGDQGDAPGGAG